MASSLDTMDATREAIIATRISYGPLSMPIIARDEPLARNAKTIAPNYRVLPELSNIINKPII